MGIIRKWRAGHQYRRWQSHLEAWRQATSARIQKLHRACELISRQIIPRWRARRQARREQREQALEWLDLVGVRRLTLRGSGPQSDDEEGEGDGSGGAEPPTQAETASVRGVPDEQDDGPPRRLVELARRMNASVESTLAMFAPGRTQLSPRELEDLCGAALGASEQRLGVERTIVASASSSGEKREIRITTFQPPRPPGVPSALDETWSHSPQAVVELTLDRDDLLRDVIFTKGKGRGAEGL